MSFDTFVTQVFSGEVSMFHEFRPKTAKNEKKTLTPIKIYMYIYIYMFLQFVAGRRANPKKCQ